MYIYAIIQEMHRHWKVTQMDYWPRWALKQPLLKDQLTASLSISKSMCFKDQNHLLGHYSNTENLCLPQRRTWLGNHPIWVQIRKHENLRETYSKESYHGETGTVQPENLGSTVKFMQISQRGRRQWETHFLYNSKPVILPSKSPDKSGETHKPFLTLWRQAAFEKRTRWNSPFALFCNKRSNIFFPEINTRIHSPLCTMSQSSELVGRILTPWDSAILCQAEVLRSRGFYLPAAALPIAIVSYPTCSPTPSPYRDLPAYTGAPALITNVLPWLDAKGFPILNCLAQKSVNR